MILPGRYTRFCVVFKRIFLTPSWTGFNDSVLNVDIMLITLITFYVQIAIN